MEPDVRLSHKQGDAYYLLKDYKTTELVFGGGANGGKTWLGCYWLVEMCFKYPETKWFIGREELKRLRDTTLITFWKVCKAYGVKEFRLRGGIDHFLEHRNGSRIDLLDLKYLPRDPLYERYGSSEYTSGWLEEGGEVHFDAYDTLKGRIGRHLNDKYNILRKLLVTANPKKNWMYPRFYKPWRNGTLPDHRAFIQSLVDDNPYRESGSKEALESIENESKRQRLLFGNWEYEDEPDQLIKYEWLEACKSTKVVNGKKSLGVDVARFGDDKSSLCSMQGNRIYNLESYPWTSIDEVVDLTKMRILGERMDPKRVGVDGVGVGAGVVDYLHKANFDVYDIISGQTKIPTYEEFKKYEFNNLRSFMWWIFREDVRNGRITIDLPEDKCDSLFEDLTALKYEIERDKMIKVHSKKIIKKELGRSTDEGDAAVYSNFIRFLRDIIKQKSNRGVSITALGGL